jgi:hypothetical protein
MNFPIGLYGRVERRTIDFSKPENRRSRISERFPFPTPWNDFAQKGFSDWHACLPRENRLEFEDDLLATITRPEDQEEDDHETLPVLPKGYWTNSVSPEHDFFWSEEGRCSLVGSVTKVCGMSKSRLSDFYKALSEDAVRWTNEHHQDEERSVVSAHTSASGRSEGESPAVMEDFETRGCEEIGNTIQEKRGQSRVGTERKSNKERRRRKTTMRKSRMSTYLRSEDQETLPDADGGSQNTEQPSICLSHRFR